MNDIRSHCLESSRTIQSKKHIIGEMEAGSKGQ